MLNNLYAKDTLPGHTPAFGSNYPEVLNASSSLSAPSPVSSSLFALDSPTQRDALVAAYRDAGYRVALLDPLGLTAIPDIPKLTLHFHGLGTTPATERFERELKRIYCGAISVDCSAIRSETRRTWLFERMESALPPSTDASPQRIKVLERLLDAEMWERLVATKFEHAKRFSLEGCESLIPLLHEVIEQASVHGTRQVFMSMPHRGRLNTLVNLLDVPVAALLERLDADSDIAATQRDLPYHLGGKTQKQTAQGEVTVCLAHNPSHLQSVYPVVSGMARSWNDEHTDEQALPVVIHGDAAFAGQGIVMETLNLTRKPGYKLGGTIHIIINNQIGFTTLNAMDVGAHVYCTDIARMIDAPVIHVNADRPDAVLRAAELAIAYRVAHHEDIVIDLIGYRRLGHSEHDTPSVTQPFLHAAIEAHPSVTELYHATLGIPTSLDELRASTLLRLQTHNVDTHRSAHTATAASKSGVAKSNNHAHAPAAGLTIDRLTRLTEALTHVPPDVIWHETVCKQNKKWRAAVASDRAKIDWCFAENLAYASLLDEGYGVRLSGMDVERGTFMHRHAVWHAQDFLSGKDSVYIPLDHIGPEQGSFDVVNSPLTEEAVLGYEYGYSVGSSTRLTIWEAQYGDFVNGAQVIVDQYIAAGEYKWDYQSALIVLLPHGHEGVGPEHSNAHLGRFLQLCADDNMRVAMPSTSSQWFHLLREQAKQPPKPLIVMSPKSHLYGNERSHSPLADLVDGAFATVLSNYTVRDAVTRAVLCSGKFFHELDAVHQAHGLTHVALIRVELLYPFPREALAEALAGFENLVDVVWSQEEDGNQGAWRFVRDELEETLGRGQHLSHVVRNATPTGAHSSVRRHQDEQTRIIAAALGID